MAATIAELEILVQGDAKGARAALAATERDLRALNVMALGAGAAMLDGFKTGVNAAIDLETQMNNVNSLVHMSSSELANWTKEVQRVSIETGQSSTSVAESLYEIVSTGYAGADALNIMEVSAKGAIAGLTTTAVAADALTSILQGMHLQASDSERVMNTLFQAVNLGKFTFEELNAVIGDNITNASQLGISLEELTASYAQLSLIGIKPPEISTEFKNFTQAFLKPNPAMKAALHNAGYANGQELFGEKGLMGALDWAWKTVGVDEFGKLDLTEANKLFSARGGSNFLRNAFGNDQGQAFREMIQSMMEAQGVIDPVTGKITKLGAMQLALNEQMKSTSYHINRMKMAFNVLAQLMTQALLPAIKATTDLLYQLAMILQRMPGWVRTLTGVLLGLAGAFLILKGGARFFHFDISSMIYLMLRRFVPAIAVVSAAIGAAAFIWTKDIGGVRTTIEGVIEAWHRARAFFSKPSASVADIIGHGNAEGPRVLRYLHGLGQSLAVTAAGMFEVFGRGKGVNQVLNMMPGRVRKLARPYLQLSDAVGDVVSRFQSRGFIPAMQLLDTRASRIGRSIEKITGIKGLHNVAEGFLRIGSGMAQAFVSGEGVSKILDRMPKRFQGVARPFLLLADAIGDIYAALTHHGFRAAWEQFVEELPGIKQALGDIGHMALDVVVDVASWVWGEAEDLTVWLWTQLTTHWGDIVDLGENAISVVVSIKDWIVGSWPSLMDAIKRKALAIWNGGQTVTPGPGGDFAGATVNDNAPIGIGVVAIAIKEWAIRDTDNGGMDLAKRLWHFISTWGANFNMDDMAGADQLGQQIGEKVGTWLATALKTGIENIFSGGGTPQYQQAGGGYAAGEPKFDVMDLLTSFLGGFFSGFDTGGDKVFEPWRQKIHDWWVDKIESIYKIFTNPAEGAWGPDPNRPGVISQGAGARAFSLQSIVEGMLDIGGYALDALGLPDLAGDITGWVHGEITEVMDYLGSQVPEPIKRLANGDFLGAVRALFGAGGNKEFIPTKGSVYDFQIPKAEDFLHPRIPPQQPGSSTGITLPTGGTIDMPDITANPPNVTTPPVTSNIWTNRDRFVIDVRKMITDAFNESIQGIGPGGSGGGGGGGGGGGFNPPQWDNVLGFIGPDMATGAVKSIEHADWGYTGTVMSGKIGEAGSTQDWANALNGTAVGMHTGLMTAAMGQDWAAIPAAIAGSMVGTAGAEGAAVGSAIGQGMYNGMIQWIGPMANAAATMVGAAMFAAKVAAAIGSPSKKSMEISERIVDGFILPFKRRKGEMAGAVGGFVPFDRTKYASVEGGQAARGGGPAMVQHNYLLKPEDLVALEQNAQRGGKYAAAMAKKSRTSLKVRGR